MKPAPRKRASPGFSLIEVIVAMVLLGVVLTMLASFSLGSATQMVGLSRAEVRQAVSAREVNRLTALPYDSLANAAGCRTVTVAGLQHTACITITAAGQNRNVQIIVTPQRGGYADTLVFERAAPYYNPFNTP